jgi:deazaflavin-dependent oxidoreductase (nitroreductase family)
VSRDPSDLNTIEERIEMPQRGKKKPAAKKSSALKPTAKISRVSAAATKAASARKPSKAAAAKKTAAPKTAASKAAPKPAARERAPKTTASEKSAGAQPQERKLPRWIADHIARYLATNGDDGHMWRGYPTLLLTTTGRRSNQEQLLPLIYGRDGDRYIVVASRGGAADHPGWYKNLVENPGVKVQVKGDRFRARARTANADERPRLWRTMAKIFPFYDQYQSKTARLIPVILIERQA